MFSVCSSCAGDQSNSEGCPILSTRFYWKNEKFYLTDSFYLANSEVYLFDRFILFGDERISWTIRQVVFFIIYIWPISCNKPVKYIHLI